VKTKLTCNVCQKETKLATTRAKLWTIKLNALNSKYI